MVISGASRAVTWSGRSPNGISSGKLRITARATRGRARPARRAGLWRHRQPAIPVRSVRDANLVVIAAVVAKRQPGASVRPAASPGDHRCHARARPRARATIGYYLTARRDRAPARDRAAMDRIGEAVTEG